MLLSFREVCADAARQSIRQKKESRVSSARFLCGIPAFAGMTEKTPGMNGGKSPGMADKPIAAPQLALAFGLRLELPSDWRVKASQ